MTETGRNELAMKVYGDGDLQERLVRLIADTFDTEVYIKNEKDYYTTYGDIGHYMNIKLKVNQ